MTPSKNKPCPCGSGKKYKHCCFPKEFPEPGTAAASRRPPEPRERDAAVGPVTRSVWSQFWAPAFLPWCVAVYELLGSTVMQGAVSIPAGAAVPRDYAHFAYWVHDQALNALAIGGFAGAAFIALVPPLREAAVRHLEKASRLPAKAHLAWVVAAFAGLMAWWGFVRYCQYRAYLLPQDTSSNAQSAYVFLHYGDLSYPEWGMKVLSQHITLIMGLFSPALLIWENPLTLLFLQNLFVCSIPFAAYGLIYLETSSSFAGVVGMALASSSPFIYELLTSNLHIAPLAAFFLWAMFFLKLGNRPLAGLFLAAMATCNEQAPLIYLGLALYSIHALRERKPWNWLVGGALCAASLALFVGETSVIKHYERLEPELSAIGTSKWAGFAHLVPKGTPFERVFAEMAGHPFRTAANVFSSVYVFYPLGRALCSMGFLCLLAPMQMLPFATAFLPHILANPGDPCKFFDYHPISYADLCLHSASYMFGPLVWAAGCGIAAAHARLSRRGRQGWLLAWALAFSGLGFKYAHRTLSPAWWPAWFEAVPRVSSLIPPRARLWGLEYLLAPLSMRHWMKNIMWGPEPPDGYKTLFKPDYVLFDKAFVQYAKPPYRDQMLTFFGQNKYRKIADDAGVILLRSPDPSPRPEETPPRIELPPADPPAAEAFARYVLQAPPDPP